MSLSSIKYVNHIFLAFEGCFDPSSKLKLKIMEICISLVVELKIFKSIYKKMKNKINI